MSLFVLKAIGAALGDPAFASALKDLFRSERNECRIGEPWYEPEEQFEYFSDSD